MVIMLHSMVIANHIIQPLPSQATWIQRQQSCLDLNTACKTTLRKMANTERIGSGEPDPFFQRSIICPFLFIDMS